MLQKSTLKFLKDLVKNNTRPWFDEHRHDYLAAKDDVVAMVEMIHQELSKDDPWLKDQEAKNKLFRIFRDVRFAKDKTPYKNHFGIYLSRGGRKWEGGGYYIHIQPGNCFAGAGVWMPQPPLLKAIRQEIDYNWEAFQSITGSKSFKATFKKWEGEQQKNLPKDYTADNPAIEILRYKSFIVTTPISDEDITGKNAVKKIAGACATGRPLVEFLNRAMD